MTSDLSNCWQQQMILTFWEHHTGGDGVEESFNKHSCNNYKCRFLTVPLMTYRKMKHADCIHWYFHWQIPMIRVENYEWASKRWVKDKMVGELNFKFKHANVFPDKTRVVMSLNWFFLSYHKCISPKLFWIFNPCFYVYLLWCNV